MSKAENGRLGDFAEITNNAIGTNFVAENGFIGDHKMPEPEKVQGDFSQVGYRGDSNLRQSVQSGVQTTGGEVKQATGKPEGLYAKTGASPDKHFQNSTKETEAVNSRNQGGMIHKQFKQAEKNLQEATVPARLNHTPADGSMITPDKWRKELDGATKDLPVGVAEGIKDYIVQSSPDWTQKDNFTLSNEKNVTDVSVKDTLLNLRGVSMLGGQTSPEVSQARTDRHNEIALEAEKRMREDVANAYRAHYGKDFSEDKYREDINKTVQGVKNIAKAGHTKESLQQITNFLEHSYRSPKR